MNPKIQRLMQGLILINVIVITNLAIVGFNWANLMYTISGWYSIGGCLIAVFMVVEALHELEWVKKQTGGRDINQIIARMDMALCEVEELVKSPELKMFLELLVTPKKEVEKDGN